MEKQTTINLSENTKIYCNGVLTLKPVQLKNGKWMFGVVSDDNSLFETLFFDEDANQLDIIIRSQVSTLKELILCNAGMIEH